MLDLHWMSPRQWGGSFLRVPGKRWNKRLRTCCFFGFFFCCHVAFCIPFITPVRTIYSFYFLHNNMFFHLLQAKKIFLSVSAHQAVSCGACQTPVTNCVLKLHRGHRGVTHSQSDTETPVVSSHTHAHTHSQALTLPAFFMLTELQSSCTLGFVMCDLIAMESCQQCLRPSIVAATHTSKNANTHTKYLPIHSDERSHSCEGSHSDSVSHLNALPTDYTDKRAKQRTGGATWGGK